MHIGQTFQIDRAADDRALYVPADPRWYALIVPPQREGQAVAYLERMGVYAFFPVKRKVSVIRGKRISRDSRYLPGYVFARFPGRPIWHKVFASAFISDAIRLRSTGEPGILRASDLAGIQAMAPRDEAKEAAHKRAKAIRPGDRAVVMGGILEGREIEVSEIRAGRAVFRVTMFGSDREAEVDAGLLRKGGGA